MAYLDYRDSVVFDVSYFFNFPLLPNEVPVKRAARLVYSALRFRELLERFAFCAAFPCALSFFYVYFLLLLFPLRSPCSTLHPSPLLCMATPGCSNPIQLKLFHPPITYGCSRQLQPDRQRDQLWCMKMYEGMFNSCRIPHLDSDRHVKFTGAVLS